MFDFLTALKPTRIDVADGNQVAAMVAQAQEPRGIAIFVHGFTGSKEDFAIMLPDMADLGWTSIAYDQRGHYESTAHGSFELAAVAADAVAVARWASAEYGSYLPVFLVGHSLGGLVTQQAVALGPEQFCAAIMMCSGSEGIALRGRELNPVTVGRLDTFVEMAQDRDIDQLWDDMAKTQGIDMSNPFSRFLQERFVGSSKEALVTFAHALGYTPDLADAVIASKVPVRWCFGADDGSWDQSLQCEAANRYGTTPVVIPDAMHSPMFENTDATVEVLDGFFKEFAASAH